MALSYNDMIDIVVALDNEAYRESQNNNMAYADKIRNLKWKVFMEAQGVLKMEQAALPVGLAAMDKKLAEEKEVCEGYNNSCGCGACLGKDKAAEQEYYEGSEHDMG